MNTKWQNILEAKLRYFPRNGLQVLHALLLLLAVLIPVRAQQTLSAPVSPADSNVAADQKPVPVGKPTPAELKVQQVAAAKKHLPTAPVVAGKPDAPRQDVQPGGQAAAVSSDKAVSKTSEPRTPLDYLKNNEWQKHAEIRSGKVIFLRRSTDVPPAPDETVILRWRTPTEFSKGAFLSSKGHNANPPTQ